jgi:integrase
MSVFKRGKKGIYYYKFKFLGQQIYESAKTKSKTLAEAAERKRHRQLEEGLHGIKRPTQPKLFRVAATDYLEAKKSRLAPKSLLIEKTNLSHLLPEFGGLLVTDITAEDIRKYQERRRSTGKKPAKPKTVNLEIGTLRAILRRARVWASIQPDVHMLQCREDVGRAISGEEERRLLDACSRSRSRSLYPAVVISLNTGLRYSELRLLRWNQIALEKHTLSVGRSKTSSGDGREVPLNQAAQAVIEFWSSNFPNRNGDDFVFPSERYGASGDEFKPCTYEVDPTKPITSWKVGWQNAKSEKDDEGRKHIVIKCRWHDLRHTACTRMLEKGVPFSVVASIMGWSAGTTVRMAKRYGHIGQAAQRQALDAINTGEINLEAMRNRDNVRTETRPN